MKLLEKWDPKVTVGALEGMDRSRLELSPGLWVDARRAVYLEQAGVLCVADLHLGYAWAHRKRGQLLPLRQDPAAARLLELCRFYQPKTVAVLGDVVHETASVREIRAELDEFLRVLGACCMLTLILGNHDRGLREWCSESSTHLCEESMHLPGFTLVHGNKPPVAAGETRILMGHEHPAISLGDHIRSSRYPCFLVSAKVLVLPAFSLWAAGADVRSGQFLSKAAAEQPFDQAIAILNDKLLPVRL